MFPKCTREIQRHRRSGRAQLSLKYIRHEHSREQAARGRHLFVEVGRRVHQDLLELMVLKNRCPVQCRAALIVSPVDESTELEQRDHLLIVGRYSRAGYSRPSASTFGSITFSIVGRYRSPFHHHRRRHRRHRPLSSPPPLSL